MPYQFFSEQEKLSAKQEKYLLSPKDINTIALIPELVEAGIDSFKIEGRMKRPEYAAAVASLYRRYTDLYVEHGRNIIQISGDGDLSEGDTNASGRL
jgi:putative protease